MVLQDKCQENFLFISLSLSLGIHPIKSEIGIRFLPSGTHPIGTNKIRCKENIYVILKRFPCISDLPAPLLYRDYKWSFASFSSDFDKIENKIKMELIKRFGDGLLVVMSKGNAFFWTNVFNEHRMNGYAVLYVIELVGIISSENIIFYSQKIV